MKVVILAGGFGTRLGEETDIRPKPMVEVGGRPILWHIMKSYTHYGYSEFIILLGYKGYAIKEYFSNYMLHQANMTLDFESATTSIHSHSCENWKITLLDTGLNSMTGGRIKRADEFLNGEPFLLTYGDGVADVNISDVVDFHKSHGRMLTMTSVQPVGRFGALNIDCESKITGFKEKPKEGGAWINAGYFVCENSVLDQIDGDATTFEEEPLENLAQKGELMAYKHHGFWQCMDTLRDKHYLNDLWNDNQAAWKKWD